METVLPSEEDLRKKLFHKQTLIISDQQKYPQLFRWKTATIVMGAVSSILLIVLLVVIYNIEAEEEIKTNLTFLSSVIGSTQILRNKIQVINFSQNFQKIYGTTKFSNAKLVHKGNKITEDIVRNRIYSQENEKLLYLVEIQVVSESKGEEIHYPARFALFMNSQFPMPKDEDYDNTLTYYSFEIKQERKSSLLSLPTSQHLKLYSSNPEIKSIAECKNYKFEPQNEDRKGSFRLLNDLVHFSFQNTRVQINTKGWRCFDPALESEEQLQTLLKSIIHPEIMNENTYLELKMLEVYYLS